MKATTKTTRTQIYLALSGVCLAVAVAVNALTLREAGVDLPYQQLALWTIATAILMFTFSAVYASRSTRGTETTDAAKPRIAPPHEKAGDVDNRR